MEGIKAILETAINNTEMTVSSMGEKSDSSASSPNKRCYFSLLPGFSA